MVVDADILLVAATLLCGVSFASIVSGWAARVWPLLGLIGFVIGMGLFAYIWTGTGGFIWTYVPDAFIHVAARILK